MPRESSTMHNLIILSLLQIGIIMKISVLLYHDFETLDVFGPVEVFGKVEEFSICFYSFTGALVSNRDNVQIQTKNLDEAYNNTDVIFIPGGWGARQEVKNHELIKKIEELGRQSKYILTVCTGSAILAMTTLLDNKKATSNKRAFDFPCSLNSKVDWVKTARWVEDSNIFTSSGISAGTDMALAFVSKVKGIDTAREVASIMEYRWNENSQSDEFSGN